MGQADSQDRCSGGEREGTTLLPDDPPAIQELMNDLNGFTLLQGYLVLQYSSVGFDGDVGLTWRGRAIVRRSTQHMAPRPSPPLWAWGFLQLELRTPSPPVLPTPPGGTWTSVLCLLYSGELAHFHPPPSTPEARSSHNPRDLASHLHTRSGQTGSGEEEYPSSGT